MPLFKRQLHIHGKNAQDQSRNHDAQRGQCQFLNKHIQVVIDNRSPRIHQARKYLGKNMRLLAALAVFVNNIIQEIHVLFGKLQFSGVCPHFIDDPAVG